MAHMLWLGKALALLSSLAALVIVAAALVAQLFLPGWRFPETNMTAHLAVVIVLAAAAAWTLGFAVRFVLETDAGRRRMRTLETEMGHADLELAVAIKRDRAAQDVHDIMAQSLSVIVAQADGALFLKDRRPEAAAEGLTAIAQAGRESLDDLRVLVQSQSNFPEGHSYPSLADVDGLIRKMTAAGLTVTEATFGEEGTLTAHQQLAVYRILQESLTNALRHSPGPAALRITRDWRGPGLALNVVSTAASDLTLAVPRQVSRGITGMTERARLAGGWLSAEPDEDDARRFIVTAFIPTMPPLESTAALR
jgi:signal transduction histidine kinase